jgi:hypothetical protein
MIAKNTVAEVAPTLSTTTVLFDSNSAFQGSPLDVNDIVRYIATITNSAAGTINVYKSQDAVTYDLWQQTPVPIPTAPAVANTYDFAVDGLRHIRVDWVNGGVTQTTWRIGQELVEKQRVKQS